MSDSDMREWEQRLSTLLREQKAVRAESDRQLQYRKQQTDKYLQDTVKPAFETIRQLFQRTIGFQVMVLAGVSSPPFPCDPEQALEGRPICYAEASLTLQHLRREPDIAPDFTYGLNLTVTPRDISLTTEWTAPDGGHEKVGPDPTLTGGQSIMHITSKKIVDDILDAYEARLKFVRQ